MSEKILKLVYDYSVKGKLVDLKFVDKLVEIVVKNKMLGRYVNRAVITNKFDKNDDRIECAAYNSFDNEILVDSESMNLIMEDMSYYDCLFNDFEKVIFRNLHITQIILHELEHAYQFKQAEDKSNKSDEAEFIRSCFRFKLALRNPDSLFAIFADKLLAEQFSKGLSLYHEVYTNYYDLNPTERLAQVNSYETLMNSIYGIKNAIPNLYEFNYASLVQEYLKGYQNAWNNGICPTKVYLYLLNNGKVWTDLDFYSPDYNELMDNVSKKYSLTRRMSLGLPITTSEYDETYNWLTTTNKFNI